MASLTVLFLIIFYVSFSNGQNSTNLIISEQLPNCNSVETDFYRIYSLVVTIILIVTVLILIRITISFRQFYKKYEMFIDNEPGQRKCGVRRLCKKHGGAQQQSADEHYYCTVEGCENMYADVAHVTDEKHFDTLKL